MPRYHTTQHGNIPFTPEEEVARDAEEAEWLAGQTKRDALAEIQRLETIPRRIRENLLTLGSTDQVLLDEEAAIATERLKL